MPSKKGFTLVEIIATITIMLLITIIVTPNIITYIDRGKDRQYEQLESQIISAAKDYYIKNKDSVASNSNQIPLNNLTNKIDEEFIKSGEIIDPRNSGKCLTGAVLVELDGLNGQRVNYSYTPSSEDCE